MTRIPVLATLLALGLVPMLVTGCGSGDEEVPKGAKSLAFKLTDEGCLPNTAKAPAGPIVFDVENAGTTKVTEFEILEGDAILGEKENLSDGLSGNFSLTLEPGSYTIYCPGGSDERGTLIVSGKSKA